MKDKIKSWQGWLLFGLAMVIIFALGLMFSTFLENREAESEYVGYVKKKKINGLEARSSVFAQNYPREYQTWADTTSTEMLNDLMEGLLSMF